MSAQQSRTIGDVVIEHSNRYNSSTRDGLALLNLQNTQHYTAANLYLTALSIIKDQGKECAELAAFAKYCESVLVSYEGSQTWHDVMLQKARAALAKVRKL